MPSALPPALAQLSARREAMIGRLTRWANLNSGSTHAPGLAKMADTLLAELRAEFPAASCSAIPLVGPGAPAISVRMRPDAPLQLLLSGHYDTVYDAQHPFQSCTRLNEDTLRGPGVGDMKGGLVVLAEALRAFEADQGASSAPPRIGWQILLTPDEETGSIASAPLLAAAAKTHHLGLVFEPARANGDAVRTRMGTGILTATCRGRAAHAGRDPQNGRNAILALAEFLPRADAVNQMQGVLLNVGSIHGGGAVNIVPDHAAAELNLRVASAASEKIVRSALADAAAPINAREGYHLEITGQLNRPPKEVSPRDEIAFAAWQHSALQLGVGIEWQDVAGGSDGNLLSAAGLPCLDGLGPIADGLHSPAERVHLPSLVERCRVAAFFLHNLASGAVTLPFLS